VISKGQFGFFWARGSAVSLNREAHSTGSALS